MKTALRSLALTIAATASLAACSNDSKKNLGDVLAEDSTLAREVLAARGDTLAQPIDTVSPEELAPPSSAPASAPVAVAAVERTVATPAPVLSSTEAVASVDPQPTPNRSSATPVRRAAESRRRVVSRRSTARRSQRVVRAQINDVIVPSSRQLSAPRQSERRVESTPMRSSALLPAGLELALAADQRVCRSMSRVGDKFSTHVSEDVVGPVGVVIPKGTPVMARVVSTKGDIDLAIESFTMTKRNYAPASLVTEIETERVGYPRHTARNATAGAGLGAAIGAVAGGGVQGALIGAAGGAAIGTIASRPKVQKDLCIPEGGDITARLVEPLRISL